MSRLMPSVAPSGVEYPESDGLPMAENTVQYEWIVTIKGGIDDLFRDDPDVFVAGDLFWYPVEGDNRTVLAPDAMVAFGRPKGHRRSYRQWEEGGVAPQVAFEVRSPGNDDREMTAKRSFYERYGVEEYYEIDPDGEPITLRGWRSQGGTLQEIRPISGWVSPRLGVRFELADGLAIYRPDGRRFETFQEIARRADGERLRADRLAAKLRALGIDPDE